MIIAQKMFIDRENAISTQKQHFQAEMVPSNWGKFRPITLLIRRYGIETVRKQDIHVVTKDTLDHIFYLSTKCDLDHVQIWEIEQIEKSL